MQVKHVAQAAEANLQLLHAAGIITRTCDPLLSHPCLYCWIWFWSLTLGADANWAACSALTSWASSAGCCPGLSCTNRNP